MSATIIYKMEQAGKLPEPVRATLLTVDEYNEFASIIDRIEHRLPEQVRFGNYFYLREEEPQDDGTVAYVDDGDVQRTRASYFDFFEDPEDKDAKTDGTGTRPVLVYKSGLFAAGLKPGDVIAYTDPILYDVCSFTVLSDTMAICNKIISNEVFDDFCNDYENSAIKERVDEWFEEKVRKKIF